MFVVALSINQMIHQTMIQVRLIENKKKNFILQLLYGRERNLVAATVRYLAHDKEVVGSIPSAASGYFLKASGFGAPIASTPWFGMEVGD